MKKYITLIICMSALLLTSCNNTPEQNIENPPEESTKISISENYLGSDFKWNYVWWWAMNLAWTELSENIIKEKIKLATEDKIALEMVDKLNNPVFTKSDLDKESYYIKSGYGQEMVEAINKESKQKFPNKSFADLDISLNPKDIISYAYFFKKVEYPEVFKDWNILFGNKNVEGFFAIGEQKNNVKIIKYVNDNNFIVKLDLKDDSDELFLAKGFDMENPSETVKQINQGNSWKLKSISRNEVFKTPKIYLDVKRNYTELVDKFLTNKWFEKYMISKMFENINFSMDEKWAKVENEAVIDSLATSEGPSWPPKKYKKFILNKPYRIIMKRKDSKNPYFILGVNNTELMKKN